MNSPDDVAVRAQWERQRIWSQAGDAVKRRIRRTRLCALLLATAGAVLGTLSVEVGGWIWLSRTCAALAAVALALVPIVGGARGRGTVQDWTRVRAVSESLKAEVYVFLAGVSPYRGDDRVSHLLDVGDRIVADNAGLTAYTVGVSADERDLPAVRDVAGYLDLRLNGQVDGYYRPNAELIHTRVRRLGFVQLVLTVTGAVLAAVSGFVPAARLGVWVGVIVTVGAAVGTHVAAERYEYEEVECTRTADQLTALRTRFLAGPRSRASDDEFVAAAERVISMQNRGWMARQTAADPEAEVTRGRG